MACTKLKALLGPQTHEKFWRMSKYKNPFSVMPHDEKTASETDDEAVSIPHAHISSPAFI
jgi:hypothetical protein